MQARLSMWLPALGLLALAASAWFGLTRLAMERLEPIGSAWDASSIPATQAARPGPESFELVGVVTALGGGDGRSLLVVIQANSMPETSCGLKPGTTAVLSWGAGTKFDPAQVVEEKAFPANLVGARISAGGRMRSMGAEGCRLSADRVRVF